MNRDNNKSFKFFIVAMRKPFLRIEILCVPHLEFIDINQPTNQTKKTRFYFRDESYTF